MVSNAAKASRWKNAEKGIVTLLAKFGVTAERISRGSDFGKSIDDVRVYGAPELKVDSKYSVNNWKTSRLLEEVREKYCINSIEVPILFCKGYKEQGYKVTIDGDYFAMLLAHWLGKGTKEELEKIFYGR